MMKFCSECDQPHYAKGLCNKHWQRFRKNGDLELHNRPMPENRRRALGRWRSMVRRCTNPAAFGYHRYGGRGIYVCDRWLNDFDAYYRDVGDPPARGLSIDRIDNDGPYAPWNVRWADAKTQAANRKNRPDTCRRGHRWEPQSTYTRPSDGARSCCICDPRKHANPDAYLEHGDEEPAEVEDSLW